VRREYQNALYNHKENRPLTLLSTSLLPIKYPNYSLAMACRPTVLFPNAPKGKYKRGTTSWCGHLKRFEMEQGLLLEIVMMTTNHSTGAKELREKCWLCPSSTLGCGRKQMHWLARVILNEAFSPKSTMTLTRVFEDPLLLIYFGILISLWPSFYVNHYAHKQELRDNILVLPSLRSCKLNTFVLLLVNQQCCFAIDMH